MRKFTPRKAVGIPKNVSKTAVAVLASGGVQSAILIAHLLEEFETVYPVYVRQGLPFESAEEQQLRRFLAAIRGPKLGRLAILEKTASEVSDGSESESSDRTLGLISRAVEWCAANGIDSLALGTLEECKLADGGIGQRQIRIITPFATISRASVLELGRDLPLEFTFSCSRPVVKALTVKHCGQCIKCQMRKVGFAGIRAQDRTRYADNDKLALSAS